MIGQRANFTTGPDWLGIHKIPVKPSGLTPFEYTLNSSREFDTVFYFSFSFIYLSEYI